MSKEALVEKQLSKKLDTKLVALIKEAYSKEIRSNLIEKSVVVRIAEILGIKGVFKIRKIILIVNLHVVSAIQKSN